MDRFVKRSMEIRINAPKECTGWPLIALHKVLVTVRQIFSDEPAMEDRAIFQSFGGAPFPLRRLHDQSRRVLMRTAPLSKRFNFESILTRKCRDVNAHLHHDDELCRECQKMREKGCKNCDTVAANRENMGFLICVTVQCLRYFLPHGRRWQRRGTESG